VGLRWESQVLKRPEDWVFKAVEAFSLEEKSSSTADGGKGFWV
jgi:hypothetical protein